MDKVLNVFVINASLSAPSKSKARQFAQELLSQMQALNPINSSITDIINLNILPGVDKVEGPNDDWPEVAARIEAADVVIFATPIWWGSRSSLMQRVIERMDSYTTKEGYGDLQGRVAGIVISGGEDGGQAVQAGLMEALTYFGFTLPPYCGFYQLGDNDDRTAQQIKGTAKGLIQLALQMKS